MKNIGVVRKIIGIMVIRWCDFKRCVSQEIYFTKIHDKFGMKNLNPLSTSRTSHK